GDRPRDDIERRTALAFAWMADPTGGPMGTTFVEKYPSIARWVREGGRIEIGHDGHTDTFARAIKDGGISWKGEADYRTIGEALKDMERGIKDFMEGSGLAVRRMGKEGPPTGPATRPRK